MKRITVLSAAALFALSACAQQDHADAEGVSMAAHVGHSQGAVFNDAGETSIPDGFRTWPFIGAPLTPNGLNGGQAAFPEFHHVYVEPTAFAHYKETGEWPEGTTIVKELVLLQEADHADSSSDEPSGRGFFADAHGLNGIDMMVKDSERFADTSNWGFFNFGHHAPPYAESAKALPKENCAFCHEASAHEDMVFKNFYPILSYNQ